jgi:hypothetical protein
MVFVCCVLVSISISISIPISISISIDFLLVDRKGREFVVMYSSARASEYNKEIYLKAIDLFKKKTEVICISTGHQRRCRGAILYQFSLLFMLLRFRVAKNS